MSVKKLNVIFYGVLCLNSQLGAQEPIEVVAATVQSPEIGSDLSGTHTLQSNFKTTRSLVATVGVSQEAWIPLGYFRPGGIFKVSVSGSGHSANSSAICEFSAGHYYFNVHRISSFRLQSSFDFHYKRVDSYNHAVFLRYKNGSGGANTVSITIEADRSNNWLMPTSFPEGTFESLGSASKMKANIHAEWGGSGQLPAEFNGVQINKALQVQGAPVMTRFSGVGSQASPTGFSGGTGSQAAGVNSLAYGSATEAQGVASQAIGHATKAYGDWSFAGAYAAEAHNRMSFAFGYNAYAKGGDLAGQPEWIYNSGAFAFGRNSKAEGASAIAMGTGANALGQGAVAIGWGPSATQNGSIAIGNSAQSTGKVSIAMGSGADANKDYAVAIGQGNKAFGKNSLAMGHNSEASTDNSVAIGHSALAYGKYSTAFGLSTRATDRAQTVIGQYNKEIGDFSGHGNPQSVDALFIVGNGTGNSAELRSNALVVRQNGSTTMKGDAIIEGDVGIAKGLWVDGEIHTDQKAFLDGGASIQNGLTSVGNTQLWGALSNLGNVSLAFGNDTTVSIGSTTQTSQTTLNGNVTLGKAQGDISMGAFGPVGN